MPNSSLNEASSTKTKAKKSNENKLNILTRPKRPIHSKKFDLSSDLLKQFDLNDDDSDDEEFIPFEDTEKSKIKRLNSHEDESMPLEGADEDEDDEDVDFKSNGYSDSDDDDDNDEDEDTDDSEICDDEEMDNSQSENGSKSLNNSAKQTNKIDVETSSSKNGKTKQKGIKKTKAKNLDGEKAKKSGVAKKKKPKKKVKKNLKNFALDEDTQKIISSFKNANIKISKQKKSKTNENSIVDLDEAKTTKAVNTGPFVRFKKEKLKIKPNDADNKTTDTKEVEYPAYIICQQNESNVSKSLNNNELNGNPSLSTKQMVPKEKFLPITDTESAWVCSFCENRPNSLAGLGELFGPYRIGFNSDENVYFELEERNKFKGLFNVF